MEDLHRFKKEASLHFESMLCGEGKKLMNELDNKYLVDRDFLNNFYYSFCSKLDKMENIKLKDKKKINNYMNLFDFLKRLKSSNE